MARKAPIKPRKTTARKPKAPTERAVLVTTANRGVFFGYTFDPTGETIRLRNARNVYYWAPCSKGKGFLGLAEFGPATGSKLGTRATGLEVRNVTSVADCTADAVTKFEAASWG